MNKFDFDGEELEIPLIHIIDKEHFRVEEGEFAGETFTLKNMHLEEDQLFFDAEHKEGMKEIVINFVKWILVNSVGVPE